MSPGGLELDVLPHDVSGAPLGFQDEAGGGATDCVNFAGGQDWRTNQLTNLMVIPSHSSLLTAVQTASGTTLNVSSSQSSFSTPRSPSSNLKPSYVC